MQGPSPNGGILLSKVFLIDQQMTHHVCHYALALDYHITMLSYCMSHVTHIVGALTFFAVFLLAHATNFHLI